MPCEAKEKQIKRIFYLLTEGTQGGVQTHICHLALNLKEKYDICVAMGPKGNLWYELKQQGISVYHLPSLRRSISLSKDLKALMEIIKVLKKVKPDIISTHSSKAGFLGRLAARICKTPAIFTAHGWAFTEGIPKCKKYFYIIAERIVANWSKKIICVSEYDRQLALKYNIAKKNKLVTIHNGVPNIANDLISRPEEEDHVKVVMVARFSEQKDHRLFLKAISEINTKKNLEIYLVGDGPLFQKSKELAFQLGLEESIKFLGARNDVPKLLSEAQIFVLVSKWEGLPRSIIEAMRAGLPVIASDVGGTRELIQDGETGYLIPRGDIEVLKVKFLELIENPQLRVFLGKNGRERFINQFTFKKMVKETCKVYSCCISDREK